MEFFFLASRGSCATVLCSDGIRWAYLWHATEMDVLSASIDVEKIRPASTRSGS